MPNSSSGALEAAVGQGGGLMDALGPIGMGIGAVGAIGKLIARGAANRKLGELQQLDPTYKINPLAQQRLGLANTLLNARMPGSVAAERNIYGNSANQLYNVNKVATDASQAISAASGIGGQADQAFNQLGQQEAQDYQRRYGNLVGAQEGMISEGDKVYQDQVRRYQDMAQLQGAQSENNTSGMSDISNLGWGLADFGMASRRRSPQVQYSGF